MRRIVLCAGIFFVSLAGGCDRSPPPNTESSSGRDMPGAPDGPEDKSEASDSRPETAKARLAQDVEQLIEELLEVDDQGFGYSATFSGSEFLPYDETGHIATGVLGAMRSSQSEPLREIVHRGAEAVPVLLKHMDDARTTKIPRMSGMMWMDFSDEYDFNRRTNSRPPTGVNRHDEFGSPANHPSDHSITVGDLCFVALGQIVNRHFSATRYQPTGGLIVSSPTYSKMLRKVLLDDWSDLTPDSHKRQLIGDFQKPDFEERRIGAYRRLSLYYPDAVEDLVLDALSQPAFDSIAIETFCRAVLYSIDDESEQKRAYERFVKQHGPASRAGIQEQLFDDFDSADRFQSRPKELLIRLFGLPASVAPADRPLSTQMSGAEQERFIEALIHDRSQKVGDAIRDMFLNRPNDPDFSGACLRALASRGYPELLLDQLAKIDPADPQPEAIQIALVAAIAGSSEIAVKAKLLDLLKHTASEACFMAAFPAIDRAHDDEIGEAARRLLAGLPDDTKDGGQILKMIRNRFPEQAKDIYLAFLSSGGAARADTMCNVLWNGDPLANQVLAPLLDDQRVLSNYTNGPRICDRAAQAISHTTKELSFNTDWPLERRDRQIEKLKKYCRMDAQ